MVSKKKSRKQPTRVEADATADDATPEAPDDAPSEAPTASGFNMQDVVLEQALCTGKYASLLKDYFGEGEYQQLVQLAKDAETRAVRGGPRVLLLPGIMGSKLGVEGRVFDDVLWVDPLDIVKGRIVRLALPDKDKYKPLGVMLFAYMKLKLYLKCKGFDVSYYPYDWRRSIEDLGDDLALFLENDNAAKVHLVAHSMGGLVSRAALNFEAARNKIGKLIQLGTPNFGSFLPVEALRGTCSMLKTLALVDLQHDALDLARAMLNTFPGLHQMLPSPRLFNQVPLFDNPDFWEGTGANPELLEDVPRVQDALAGPTSETYLIAGVNQETTVGLSFKDNKVVYEKSREGDGTVPLRLALLPGAKTYYIEESHGSLPNNITVEKAVVDILKTGGTKRLSTKPPESSRAVRHLSETDLRLSVPAVPLNEMGFEDYRRLLERVAAPTASPVSGTLQTASDIADEHLLDTGFGHPFREVVVSRRRQHSLEIELSLGSITAANCRSLVLGLFQGVDPAGAAAAVDDALGGAVEELVQRRMFSCEAGQVFVLPAGRSSLYADSVLFAGLGNMEAYKPSVHQFVSENIIRTFVRTHVEDFATVLMALNAGVSVESGLQSQLCGYIQGIRECDDNHTIRRITLCEVDESRYMAIKKELYRLTSTPLFEDIRVTLSERRLPEPPAPASRQRKQITATENRIYLVVNFDTREDVEVDPKIGLPTVSQASANRVLRSALLTAGGKATVLREAKMFSQDALDDLLTMLHPNYVNAKNVGEVGKALGPMILGDRIVEALRSLIDHYQLVVVHDAPAGRIPWETLSLDGKVPAAMQGLSRRYIADNLSIAKWLEQRKQDNTLEILLVVNPTEDLDGAEEEGERLVKIFGGSSAVRLTQITRGEATRDRLLDEMTSGKYDVLHYAGHAFFDQEQPARSGILCANRQVLSGAHLAELQHLPALVFFNACESGRVRAAESSTRARLDRSVGLAESFLRGGAANLIGTYWPVGDSAAKTFAVTLYGALLKGRSIGDALQSARKSLHEKSLYDWADYIHYGSYDFVLKNRT